MLTIHAYGCCRFPKPPTINTVVALDGVVSVTLTPGAAQGDRESAATPALQGCLVGLAALGAPASRRACRWRPWPPTCYLLLSATTCRRVLLFVYSHQRLWGCRQEWGHHHPHRPPEGCQRARRRCRQGATPLRGTPAACWRRSPEGTAGAGSREAAERAGTPVSLHHPRTRQWTIPQIPHTLVNLLFCFSLRHAAPCRRSSSLPASS